MTQQPAGTSPARMITAMTAAVVRARRGQTPPAEVRANLQRLPPAPALRPLLDALLAALDGAPDTAARLLDEVGPLLGRAAPPDAADGLVVIRNLANSLGDRPTELRALEGAVAAFRAAGEERGTLIHLSVALYNLAMLRADTGDPSAAVALLEEVVALDRRTSNPDLAADQAALETVRAQAATQRPPASGDGDTAR
ncbi:MAG TPA: hypothetical protein VFS21_08225 [Roseiflexaceae bacterium]|nr:hypothetical protein [Roseiflexaceae bacterium]